MKPFEVFRRKDVNLQFADGATTGSTLVKLVDESYTTNMGAGMFSVNAFSNPIASLPYDEVAICIEGTLKLTVDNVTHELAAGDSAWIPKGTEVTFAGDNAIVYYGVYPVDWRTKNAS